MTEAGWYPDPSDPAQLRLWDGEKWTDQRQPIAASTAHRPPTGPLRISHLADRFRELDQSRKITAVAAIVTSIALLMSALLLATDSDAPAGVAVDVRRQAANDPGPDPFTPPLGPGVGALPSGRLADSPRDGDGVRRVVSSSAGLFGGTGDPALCNLDALALALSDDLAKAAAFADAVAVPLDQLAGWLATLTPVILMEDTRVTSHEYRGSQAVPYEAVLQAGTVIGVDAFGSPRVRCAGGNPLGAPGSNIVPNFTGDTWDGSAPDGGVVIVTPNQSLASFELTDLATGRSFAQPPGRRLTASDTGVFGVPFGTSEVEAVGRLTAALGPPTSTDRTACLEPGLERAYYYWGSFGVRFEFGFLDAWAQLPGLTGESGGLPPNVDLTPVRPGMTVGQADDALTLAEARNPQGWLASAEDTGVVFFELGSVWRRNLSRPIDFATLQFGGLGPSIALFLTGDDPATSVVNGVVVTGTFSAPIAPASLGCFPSDVPF